jgi:hypothetical protein
MSKTSLLLALSLLVVLSIYCLFVPGTYANNSCKEWSFSMSGTWESFYGAEGYKIGFCYINAKTRRVYGANFIRCLDYKNPECECLKNIIIVKDKEYTWNVYENDLKVMEFNLGDSRLSYRYLKVPNEFKIYGHGSGKFDIQINGVHSGHDSIQVSAVTEIAGNDNSHTFWLGSTHSYTKVKFCTYGMLENSSPVIQGPERAKCEADVSLPSDGYRELNKSTAFQFNRCILNVDTTKVYLKTESICSNTEVCQCEDGVTMKWAGESEVNKWDIYLRGKKQLTVDSSGHLKAHGLLHFSKSFGKGEFYVYVDDESSKFFMALLNGNAKNEWSDIRLVRHSDNKSAGLSLCLDGLPKYAQKKE